ncbi:hypothetical protein F5X99DRAFT_364011 [Biscogniauxia marginata]|nr:hypothetical protein F5X99DRAFT_364011 [Biscogniauxia marginata]
MSSMMAHLITLHVRDESSPDLNTMPIAKKDPAAVVVSSVWAMFLVSSIFLASRIYCRAIRVRAMWWDDWLLIAGWAFLAAGNGMITELMRLKFGLTLLFSPHQHTLSTVYDITNKFALSLTKTSFAVTLLKVAQGWQRKFIWFLIISMNILLAINSITTWLPACERQALGETYAHLPAHCWGVKDATIIAMVINAYSALVDFALAALAWKIILSLKMKKHEKIGAAVAMSFGFLAGIIGIVKVQQITTINGGEDIPYRFSLLMIWGQAEPSATVVAASIPVLRVLLRDVHRSRYGASDHQGSSYYNKSDNSSVFSPNHRSYRVATGTKHDSTDEILLEYPKPASAIMCTKEIDIAYGHRAQRSSLGAYEMSDHLPVQIDLEHKGEIFRPAPLRKISFDNKIRS